MNKNTITALVLIAIISYGCAKYDDGPFFSLRTKKGRLTGDWELEKISFNGQSSSSGYYGANMIWTFERDGDFEQTIDYGSYSYSYAGDWEFDDNGEELEIVVDGSGVTFEINRLTSNELWLEQNYNGNVMEYEFEKN